MTEYVFRQVTDLAYQESRVPLVGRAESVKWLQSELEAGQTVWLHGTPGVGRHALVAHIMREAVVQAGTVLWLNAYHDDLPMLAERVLRAFKVIDHGGDLIAEARNVLQEQARLIVLTGVAAHTVRNDFVVHCVPPDVPCIVVAKSDAYASTEGLSIGPLSTANAERVVSSIATNSHDISTDPNLRHLLHYADGHPLALVIAAYQLQQGVSIAQFVANLPPSPADPLSRTIGVIDAAFKQLDSQTQGILLLMGAMFAPEIPRILLATIIGTVDDTRLDTMLRVLLKRGLIQAAPATETYRVHDVMRIYARKRLRASGQHLATLNRILKGVLRIVLQSTTTATTSDFNQLAAVADQILGATRYAAHIDDTHFLETIVKLLPRHGIDGFIQVRGYEAYFERVRQLAGFSEAPTLQRALVIVDQDAAQQTTQPSLDVEDPTQETNVLSVGDLKAALAAAEEAGDQEKVSHLNDVLGDWHMNRYDAGQAVRHYSAALGDMQWHPDRQAYLRILLKLCRACVENEDPMQALNHIGDALRQVEGFPILHAKFLDVSGDARAELNDLKGALEDYRIAADLFIANREPAVAGVTLGKAANIYLDQRQYQAASLALAQSIDLFEKAGRRALQGQALGNLGTALGYMGRWREAGRRHMMALQIAREIGDRDEECYQLGNLAFVSETEGYLEWALHYTRQALYVSLQLDEADTIAKLAFDVGRLLTQTPTMALQAVVAFEESLRYKENQQTRTFLQQTRQQLAQTQSAEQDLIPPEDLLTYARAAYEA